MEIGVVVPMKSVDFFFVSDSFQLFDCFGERLRAESEEEEVVVVGEVEKMSGKLEMKEGFPCFGDRGASDDGFDG